MAEFLFFCHCRVTLREHFCDLYPFLIQQAGYEEELLVFVAVGWAEMEEGSAEVVVVKVVVVEEEVEEEKEKEKVVEAL